MNVRSDLSPLPESVSEPRQSASIDFRDLYEIVTSRKRLLFPALVVCFAAAIGYIVLTPASYTATMSVMIDPRDRIPAGVDAQPMPQNPDPALVESQMRLLTSKAVLRRLIESQDLLHDPNTAAGGLQSLLAPLMSLLAGGSSGSQDPADKLAEELEKQISLKRSERTYVVDVDVAAHSRAQAVTMANGLFAAYLAEQAQQREDIFQRQTAFLDGRVNDLRGRVEQAERRVQEYRSANEIAELDGHTSPEQQLGGANAALVAARSKVGEIAARYAQLKNALTQTNFESINDAIQSPVIERLRQDYAALVRDEAYARTVLGPRHPSYLTTQAQLEATRSQIKAEVERILLATERELRAAQASEQAAEKLVTNTEVSTNDLGDRTLQLTDLERDAATLRATFEKTLAARENIRRDVVDSPLSVLIDPPVAGNAKTSPKTLAALIVALAAALNLWIVAALIADFRQRGTARIEPPVRAPRKLPPAALEQSRALVSNAGFVEAAPWPASLPFSASGKSREFLPQPVGRAIAVAASAEPEFSEAIRSVYDRLRRLPTNRGAAPRIALASSPGDPAGPVLALALARIARLQGERVMIVDCEGADSMLARFAQEQSARSDIVVVPLAMKTSTRRALAAQMPFDLILLSCGSLKRAGDAIGDWRLADGVLAVGRGDASEPALNDAVAAAGLTRDCVGTVLFTDPNFARSQACA